MPGLPTISVCMIVKNEEKNLPRALSSVKGLADEIIVVDTGSEDRTVDTALEHGALVFHFPWCDDFSAARNESLKHATKECILWLDADDEVNGADIHKIRHHLKKHGGTAVYLKLTSLLAEGDCRSLQLRIFPNHKGIFFKGRIHEQAHGEVKARGIKATRCDGEIIHHGYHDPGELNAHLLRDESILREEVRRDPMNFEALFYLSRTLRGLKRHGEALELTETALSRAEKDASLYGEVLHRGLILDKYALLGDLGRTPEAAGFLEEWRKKFPSDNLIKFAFGEALFHARSYERAFEELFPLKDTTMDSEMLPVLPGRMKEDLRRYLGVSALFCGKTEVAKGCFREALADDRAEISLYHYLSLAEEKSGDQGRAIEVLKEALSRWSDDQPTKKRLFFLFLNSDRFGEALAMFEKLNGSRNELDVTSGMFFLACEGLDLTGMSGRYTQIEKLFGLPLSPFPEGLDLVRRAFARHGDHTSSRFFENAISKLLGRTP
jgi:glycosyltransferase involved in cell wall biosynthesis